MNMHEEKQAEIRQIREMIVKREARTRDLIKIKDQRIRELECRVSELERANKRLATGELRRLGLIAAVPARKAPLARTDDKE